MESFEDNAVRAVATSIVRDVLRSADPNPTEWEPEAKNVLMALTEAGYRVTRDQDHGGGVVAGIAIAGAVALVVTLSIWGGKVLGVLTR